MALKLIITEDGSHSLLNEVLNETYHSTHGAIQESVHVFEKNGLDYFHQTNPSENLTVLEVGFGTGLNALLTMEWASRAEVKVHYISLEAFPLDVSVIDQINYPQLMGGDEVVTNFASIHQAAWDEEVSISDWFVLEKRLIRLEEYKTPGAFADVIFFDAFAPSKQPELWALPILAQMKESLKTPGVFVTYCAKGQLKRDLKSLGFIVESLPGPPGKKEMVRAIR